MFIIKTPFRIKSEQGMFKHEKKLVIYNPLWVMSDENGLKFYSWVLVFLLYNQTLQRDDTLFIKTIPQSVSFLGKLWNIVD